MGKLTLFRVFQIIFWVECVVIAILLLSGLGFIISSVN